MTDATATGPGAGAGPAASEAAGSGPVGAEPAGADQTAALAETLGGHAFLAGLDRADLEALAAYARPVRFDAGTFLLRENEPAETFYLIRYGRVALEIAEPRTGPMTIETLDEGDVLGWSWLLPPYRWHLDARALTLVRAIALDAEKVRAHLDAHPQVGYEVLKRGAAMVADRLHHTRLRLLDVYGHVRS